MTRQVSHTNESTVFDVTTPPVPPMCARGEARQFSVRGRPWLVCEDGSLFGPALIFFGPGVARRVRRYPCNWRELTDEGLQELSLSS